MGPGAASTLGPPPGLGSECQGDRAQGGLETSGGRSGMTSGGGETGAPRKGMFQSLLSGLRGTREPSPPPVTRQTSGGVGARASGGLANGVHASGVLDALESNNYKNSKPKRCRRERLARSPFGRRSQRFLCLSFQRGISRAFSYKTGWTWFPPTWQTSPKIAPHGGFSFSNEGENGS